MLCECLAAGGMDVVCSPGRDEFAKSHSDLQYAVNPHGLFEPDFDEMLKPGWPIQYDGMVVKVVAPFVRRLSIHDYRVAFMRRDSEEIRQSYEASFGAKITRQHIDAAVREALAQLRNRRDVQDVAELEYPDVIDDPLGAFERLGWPVNASEASARVRSELYRFRLDRLTVGL